MTFQLVAQCLNQLRHHVPLTEMLELNLIFYVDDCQVPKVCYPVQKLSVQKQCRIIYIIPYFILLVCVVSKPNILQ